MNERGDHAQQPMIEKEDHAHWPVIEREDHADWPMIERDYKWRGLESNEKDFSTGGSQESVLVNIH